MSDSSQHTSSNQTSSDSSSSSSLISTGDNREDVSFTLSDSSTESNTSSVKQEKNNSNQPKNNDQQSIQEEPPLQQKQEQSSPYNGWYKVFDVQSQQYYYYNSLTAQSAWELPDDISPNSVLEYNGQGGLLCENLQQNLSDQNQFQQQVQDNQKVIIPDEKQKQQGLEETKQVDCFVSENVMEGTAKKEDEEVKENQQQDMEQSDKEEDKEIKEELKYTEEENDLDVVYQQGIKQQQQQKTNEAYQYQQQQHYLQQQHGHAAGWYYYDFQQNVQGPFNTEQLRMWRQQLPMDLQLWYYDPKKADEEECVCMHVYELFGDKNVFEHWQKAIQGGAQGPAPTAPQWEEFMRMEQHDTTGSYAAAVRAGLPAGDSAVQAHQLQQFVQHQVPDAMNFYYWAQNYYTAPGMQQYAQYASNAVKDRSGRIISAQNLPESVTGLYSEISSWCDPQQFERAMRERTERKRKQLPPSVWKKLKKRKQESKERIRRALLMM